MSEIYLDSLSDDGNWLIKGCSMARADHPSNAKRGGASVYYKNMLPLEILDRQYLNESINFEILIEGEICKFISLYRSLSQSWDQFPTFSDNLEFNIESVQAKHLFYYLS